MGRTHIGIVHGGLYPMGGRPHAKAGDECETEGVPKTKRYGQVLIPIPHLPIPVRGRRK